MDEYTDSNEHEKDEALEPKGLIGKLRSLSKIQLLIIAIVFFFIFFSAIFFSFIGDDEAEVKRKEEAEKVVVFKTKFKTIKFYDPITVELNDVQPKRIITLKFAVELSDEKSKNETEGREEEVKDAVFRILEGKSFYDLRSVDGKILLKKEMIKSFNSIFGTGKVRNIYFNKFIMFKLES